MEKKMTFNYFYGTEADQFSFYRIPKALFTDSYFKDLSSDAKILYGLMLWIFEVCHCLCTATKADLCRKKSNAWQKPATRSHYSS